MTSKFYRCEFLFSVIEKMTGGLFFGYVSGDFVWVKYIFGGSFCCCRLKNVLFDY